VLKKWQILPRQCRARLLHLPHGLLALFMANGPRMLTTSVLLVIAAFALAAQEPSPSRASFERPQDQTDIPPQLAALVQRAAVIFSGQVTGIGRRPAEGSIQVRFNVTRGIRGTAPGVFEANFLESSPGAFSLHPGEQVVAFLHERNAAGLTSFVASNCGLFERTGADRVDLRRLRLCPSSPVLPFGSLPEPVVFWPDPRNFLPEQAPSGAFSPIIRRVLPPVRPVAASLGSVTTMNTSDFVRLISQIADESPTGPAIPQHSDPGPR
jgi:hypothetical protein